MAEASASMLVDGRTAAAPVREDGAKARQIIEGARKVFLKDGFDGASMNEIARVAGVSKGTLYVYFSSKEELFEALIREEKRAQAEQLCRFPLSETDPRVALQRFGVRFLELILRPASIDHLRTVVAVAGKFPSIGQAYYEAGPVFGRKRLAGFLDSLVAAGTLEADDTEVAAVHLMELCKAPYMLEAILCVGEHPPQSEMERHVGAAVETFLKAYGKRAGSAGLAPGDAEAPCAR